MGVEEGRGRRGKHKLLERSEGDVTISHKPKISTHLVSQTESVNS